MRERRQSRRSRPLVGGEATEARRILVVEDDADTRQLIAIALQTKGYEVDEVAEAGDALDAPGSIRARQNIARLLATVPPSQVQLEICDIGRESTRGARDRIVFTPTLVKKRPPPKTWIVGDLSNSPVVVDVLQMSGVVKRA